MNKYVIEFRNGSYFRDLESQHGCSIKDAMRFETKEEAQTFTRENDWILFNGGMVCSE